ncbi:MAG: HYR domain-containing protein, partial [Lewinella sp.]|nr:HYR domain-containing protein [Lewinella sp.]
CGISSMSLSQTIFNCADLGPNTVVLTVSDASGNTSTCRAIVKVVDPLVPAISCKSNINVVLDAAGQATLLPADLITSASDNCTPTEQLRLQLIYDAGYEDFQWVNSLDLDCDDVGVMTLGVMAFDAQGNDSDPCEVEIVVQDTQAPTLSCPADITTVNDPGQCSVLIEDLPAPGSSDNCGVELMHEISYNGADEYPAYETSAESGILQERTFEVGITTIVYTAFDPSGNDVDCNFTVTVEDNENPKTRCQNLTVSLDESGRALLTTSMVDMGTTDNCTSSLALSFNPDAPKSEQYFGCDQLGNHIVPLIATDASGNQGLCIAVITVSDAGGYCRDCEPDLLLEGIIAGGVHRAAGQIEARGTVAAGTSVGLLAGEVIRLTPGFEAEAGSVFTARIAACEPIANNAAASTHEVIQIAADHTNGPGELRIYPNPFRDRFTLLYELMEEAEVEIRLVSIDGRIKQQLQRPQLQPSGTHQLEWNSPDQPAGIYFIQLRRGNIWSSQKLVKMR